MKQLLFLLTTVFFLSNCNSPEPEPELSDITGNEVWLELEAMIDAGVGLIEINKYVNDVIEDHNLSKRYETDSPYTTCTHDWEVTFGDGTILIRYTCSNGCTAYHYDKPGQKSIIKTVCQKDHDA